MALLHEEIDRLPERCRVPVVLCDLEGLTHEQAARHLSWPIGTVKSRLMSGRERLRARLVRRGVAPTVALVKVATPAVPASAAVPAGLVEATVRAACRIAAGAGVSTAGVVPAAVALLMEGAQSAMFMSRIKFVLLACGLIAGGAVVAAQQAGRDHREPATHRPANAGATGSVAVSPADSEDDGTVVAREMAGVELGLMEDEVRQLREQVNSALQSRIHYETRSSRGESIGREVIEHARQAHMLAREAYLEKARELASRRRRVVKLEEPREADREASADVAPGGDRDRRSGGARSRPHVAATTVGSIDMDAVFKQLREGRQGPRTTQGRSR